jgi:hypothetical protein
MLTTRCLQSAVAADQVKTGKLSQCFGVCSRWFHSRCNDSLNDLAEGIVDWECRRCLKLDTAICHTCDNECYDDRPLLHDNSKNPNYTGFSLQCNGCERWWHQACHDPTIGEEYVQIVHVGMVKKKTKSAKVWKCSSCVEAENSRIQEPLSRPTNTDVDLMNLANPGAHVLNDQPNDEPQASMQGTERASKPIMPSAPTRWVCSKCGVTMSPEESRCSCSGCAQCTSGCQLARSVVGMAIIEHDGTPHRQRVTVDRPGMVSWHGVRTAENKTNHDKIADSFYKPSAKRAKSATCPWPSCFVVVEPSPWWARHDFAASVGDGQPWRCYKCGTTMEGTVLNCSCTGCATCGTGGCSLSRRHCEGPASHKRLKR